jgi:hypothetical protein
MCQRRWLARASQHQALLVEVEAGESGEITAMKVATFIMASFASVSAASLAIFLDTAPSSRHNCSSCLAMPDHVIQDLKALARSSPLPSFTPRLCGQAPQPPFLASAKLRSSPLPKSAMLAPRPQGSNQLLTFAKLRSSPLPSSHHRVACARGYTHIEII